MIVSSEVNFYVPVQTGMFPMPGYYPNGKRTIAAEYSVSRRFPVKSK